MRATMNRRAFVVTVGSILLSAIDGRCEQTAKRPHIAFLGLEPTPALIEAFREGLRDFNYVEGENIAIEWRFSKDPARYADFASEMIRLKVDVIVTGGPPTFAVRDATKTVPIVFAGISDPIRSGLVTSLAHPGGNLTGVPYLGANLAPKRLQLLKETVPKIRRVAVLVQPSDRGSQYDVSLSTELEQAARSLGVSLIVIEIRDANELENAFTRTDRERAEGLLVVNNAIFYSHRRRIAELSAAQRLPVLYDLREYVDVGGLMSYSPSLQEAFRRVATYVDKILRGAKPGDLPIEQPTKFELIINLKAAKALGLTIPPSLLARADQVIE
jgi:ABC-type uncharacterized transport system substrate-binding protein